MWWIISTLMKPCHHRAIAELNRPTSQLSLHFLPLTMNAHVAKKTTAVKSSILSLMAPLQFKFLSHKEQLMLALHDYSSLPFHLSFSNSWGCYSPCCRNYNFNWCRSSVFHTRPIFHIYSLRRCEAPYNHIEHYLQNQLSHLRFLKPRISSRVFVSSSISLSLTTDVLFVPVGHDLLNYLYPGSINFFCLSLFDMRDTNFDLPKSDVGTGYRMQLWVIIRYW
jgi:hypothetical protein